MSSLFLRSQSGSRTRTPSFLRWVWTWVSSVFDGVPYRISQTEYLVRYARRKAVDQRSQKAKPAAFHVTKYPGEISVDRASWGDYVARAQAEDRIPVFL